MVKSRSRLHESIERRSQDWERAGGASGEADAYQVLVDDVALEVVVPAVVEALLADEVADVDVAEARGFGEEGAGRRLPRARRARHQHVRPRAPSGAAVRRRHREGRVFRFFPLDAKLRIFYTGPSANTEHDTVVGFRQ